MCTCIEFCTKDIYFGRNLDLEYRFQEKVVITPRNYEFRLKNGEILHTNYAMIGMAAVADSYPFYAEASNEQGLSMAGLYFPGNAHFFAEAPLKLNLTPYELIPYFLGNYSTVAELREDLERLNITNIPYSENLPITELHWMISDGKACVVLEQMADGLKIYDNPVGVLTNNPPFPYHLANLSNYRNLTAQCAESRFSEKIALPQYGQGMGAIGLPGDASPTSRFVRAAFHKFNSVCEDDEVSSITQFFHLLDSVAMLRGVTMTKEGRADITTYSCCINVSRGIYYYTTYTNHQITAVKMTEKEKTKHSLSVYELAEEQHIKYE